MTGRARSKPDESPDAEALEPVRESLQERVDRLRMENEAMTLELENAKLRKRLAVLPDRVEL